MKVEVLYFEGCQNHEPTVERVREALRSENETADVLEIEVRTRREAESRGFLGSPSVRIDGLDIEPEARSLQNYGLSCRTYLNGPTRSGLPSRELIRLALNEQRASPRSCCQANPAGYLTPTSVGGAAGAASSRTALVAGGIAAVLASACCLGPLLLVTVGISGAWIGNLTRLEPYRPIFIVIALVTLFFAWRNIYRPAQACQPGEVCAVPQIRRLYNVLFWASVALTLLALVFPYFAKDFYRFDD
jgi:mercuric ion transport protein